MLKFGFKTLNTLLILFVFVGIASVIVNVSFGFIFDIDWEKQISLFDGWFDNSLKY